MDLADRLAGAVWGHLVGDAVGVPYEFKDASRILSVHFGVSGTHHQPPGTWSDDGALMLALLDSLLRDRKGGEPLFDTEDQGRRFLAWSDAGDYTPDRDGRFDIGGATSSALARLRRGVRAEQAGGRDERDNGNGSLMRVLPLALVDRDSPDGVLVDRAFRASAVTHGHPVSQVACALYVLVARHLLLGASRQSAFDRAHGALAGMLPADHPEHARALEALDAWRDRSGRGYVVDSFWSAWDAFAGAQDYRGTVERAARYGRDTDTTAAIAGGLAGIRFGHSGIPAHWLSGMRGREVVDPLVARLTGRPAAAAAASASSSRRPEPAPPGARTSESHPLYVNWVEPSTVPAAAGWMGRLGMSILAGKKTQGIAGLHWRDVEADITRLAEHEHVATYVLLVEDHELVDTKTTAIAEACAVQGIELVRFPVADHGVPGDQTAYAALLAVVDERLRAGRNVLVTCKGGLGRTGTAVACLLRDAGLASDEAIAVTRRARHGAIDHGAQEAFVRSWKPAAGRPSASGPGDATEPTARRSFASIEEVLAAYDAELGHLARRAVAGAPASAGEPQARVLGAHEQAKDLWATYSPEAAARGQVIDAGQGRARFFNALSDAAVERWGQPPAPYADAVAWQRASEWVDPVHDTLIIDWVVSELQRDADPALPFPLYEGGGRKPLGKPKQGDMTARHGYGPPVFKQCGYTCVYCGLDMAASFENWLQLSVDHVVPRQMKDAGFDPALVEDVTNLVTCCRACNDFGNRYTVSGEPPATTDAFYDLRDRVFTERKAMILAKRDQERAIFARLPVAGPDRPAVAGEDA